MRISSLALLLPIALAACTGTMSTPGPAAPAAPEPPAPPAAPAAPEIAAELPRFHWRLQEATTADGTRIEALFARADKPVQLDFDKGRLAVSNTCNRMGGSYAIAGGTLTVGRMASTMMACADAKLMALDGEVGKRLEGALSLALVAGETPQLTLGNTVGDRLVFAGTPTAVIFHADVDQAIEEGTGGQHHRLAENADPGLRHDATDAIAIQDQIITGLLEQAEVGVVLQQVAHDLFVQQAIGLGARGSDCRPLG